MHTRQQARSRQAPAGDAAAAAAEPRAVTADGAAVATNGAVKVVPLEPMAKALSALKSVSSLLLYLASSSLIIILNKRLMVDDGFKYPLALTGMAQLTGALSGVRACGASRRPPPLPRPSTCGRLDASMQHASRPWH